MPDINYSEVNYTDRIDWRYSKDVKNAVRYGYQYRAASEHSFTCFLCILPQLPGVFNWWASAIFSGMAYDAFKALVKRTKDSLRKNRKKLHPLTKNFFKDPEKVRQFYDYVKDYRDRTMNVTEEQVARIREGVITDYITKETEKIYNSKGRFPTEEESRRIIEEAYEAADLVLAGRIAS